MATFMKKSGGKLAALCCFVFLYIAANGAGMWSMDAGRGEAPA